MTIRRFSIFYPNESDVVKSNDPPEEDLSFEKSLSAVTLEGENLTGFPVRSISARHKRSKEIALESFPNTQVWKYRLPREQIEGIWYDNFIRFSFRLTLKDLKKHLFWKVLRDRITVSEFLVLDHCVQQSWRESKKAGILGCEVLVIQSVLEKQRVSLRKMNDRLPIFEPSTLLITHLGPVGHGDEDEILRILSSTLRLPTKIDLSKELFLVSKEKRKIPEPPPITFIGKGYKDHGSRKPDHEAGFEIISGEQNTDHFDLEVLEIIRNP